MTTYINTEVLDTLWNEPAIPPEDKNEVLVYAVYHNKLDFINKHWNDPVINARGKRNAFLQQSQGGYNLEFLGKYWDDPMIRNQDRDDMMWYILNPRLSASTWRFILEKVTSDISPSTRGNISWQAQLAETFPEDGDYNEELNTVTRAVVNKIYQIDELDERARHVVFAPSRVHRPFVYNGPRITH